MKLIDSSRVYKPNTSVSDSLHYRPVDLDVWYPSLIKDTTKLLFEDLFVLLEQRANQYQDGDDYTGMINEFAQFYAIELGLGENDGDKLLQVETNSYLDLTPSKEKFPLIIYMAGLNGMGFENFKVLEKLAERGFIVVSIWSVGRYPGDMTNHKLDMLEQVYDAEFALRYLRSQNELRVNFDSIGMLACSWGGVSAAVMADRNPGINALVSLDGTETHYFGASEEDDMLLTEIHESDLLHPENKSISYLYLESGNKLDEYTPTDEYHYYKKLKSNEKYYLRFLHGKHEDFTCLPSTLQTSLMAVEIHNNISELTVSFFEEHLKNIDGFKAYFNALSQPDNISVKPFEQDFKTTFYDVIKGEIVDAKTQLPLAYVNIGVLNKEIGTVSNDDGKYELQVKPEMKNDTVKVSMIGYKAKSFILKDLLSRRSNTIALEEEINQLTEVVIEAQGLRQKNIGNNTTSRFISTGFGYDKLGAEMGIKINVRKKPTFVDNFNFNISYNRLSAKALFRLNIYEIEKGKPSKNIMTQNIIIPVTAKQTGLVSVDLKDYNIILNEDVIATLEWVKTEGETIKGEGIFFSLGVFNGGTLVKQTSQSRFKKFRNMGVGMNFDVRY